MDERDFQKPQEPVLIIIYHSVTCVIVSYKPVFLKGYKYIEMLTTENTMVRILLDFSSAYQERNIIRRNEYKNERTGAFWEKR